jgi:hypothetical protein
MAFFAAETPQGEFPADAVIPASVPLLDTKDMLAWLSTNTLLPWSDRRTVLCGDQIRESRRSPDITT